MSFAKIEIEVRKAYEDSIARPGLIRSFYELQVVLGGFSSYGMRDAALIMWCNYWKVREGIISYANLKKWAKKSGYDMRRG